MIFEIAKSNWWAELRIANSDKKKEKCTRIENIFQANTFLRSIGLLQDAMKELTVYVFLRLSTIEPRGTTIT